MPNFGASAHSRTADGKDAVESNGCAVDSLCRLSRVSGETSAMNSRTIGLVTLCLAVAMGIALHLSAGSPAKPDDVTEARVIADAADGHNWLLNGRTFDQQHFSPLKQITDKNVGSLGLAWSLDIDNSMAVVSDPIICHSAIYLI